MMMVVMVVIMIIIMGDECIWGTVFGRLAGERGKEQKG
jgi:hypothetical protein